LDKKIINYFPKKKDNEKNLFSILILGGSQGAKIFGEVIPNVISMIKNEGYEIEVMQQCLRDQKNSIIKFYKEKNIKNYVFEFEEDILQLILSSTLAITRSGASSTAELNYTQTPFIAVPLPNSIDNHQFLNAKYYENNNCCWLLEQKNFNTKNLFNLIIKNIKDKNSLNNIRKNMGKNNNKNVYEDIESKIENYLI
jgi:UDP-N-acetylglucosamine--N-acetylmuramyl-(pentapeptide) pyrophosphoryl-undecaprenol N-acetylglucosamine transferase